MSEEVKSIFNVSEPISTGRYCAGCGEEIQERIVCGNHIKMQCECDRKRKQAEKELARTESIHKLRRNSNIPLAYQNCRFDNFQMRNGAEHAYKACKAYVDRYSELCAQGIGFVLTGNTGSGKTRLACSVANELIDRNFSVVYFNVSELYEDVSANYGRLPEAVYRSKMIILDDFGVDKTTDSKSITLYKILDHRTNYKLPTILTTNIPQKDWELYMDARSLSRLGAYVPEGCEDRSLFKKIRVDADDYRRGGK